MKTCTLSYRFLTLLIMLILIWSLSSSPPLMANLSAPVSSILPEMVHIPAGEFQMGCDPATEYCTSFSDEFPLHTVYLDSYAIDKYEVTNARYAACVAAGVCSPPSSHSSDTRESYYNNPTYADYPVIHTNWDQANTFCRWDGGRLPTEAEWEKAARGPNDTRIWPWGNQPADDCTKGNFVIIEGHPESRCVGDTTQVGSYPLGASPYGVMDMAGNVQEWVNDWYAADYYSISPSDNPSGPPATDYVDWGPVKIVRGGDYRGLQYDTPRVSNRTFYNHHPRGILSYQAGFRCAKSASPNSPPVANAGAPYSGTEGSAISLNNASASDADGDNLTFSWSVNSPLCAFSDPTILQPAITCSDNGTYNLTLTVSDRVNDPVSNEANLMVDNVAPIVDTPLVSPEPSDEGGSVTASATFSDPGTNDGPFTCMVNYGDGSGDLLASVSGNTCTSPAHTYADNGSYLVTVSVTDKDNGTGSNSTSHGVNNVAPSVGAITAPVDLVQVNTTVNTSVNFTDPGTLDTHTAVWDWDDGNTSPGTVTETNGSGSASGNHTYTTPGVYTVKVTVTDKDGGSGESVFKFIVVYDPDGGFVTGGGWIDSPPGACNFDACNEDTTGKATFGFVSKYQKGANVPTGETEFQFKAGNLNFHSSSYEWLVVAGPHAKFKGTGTINGSGDYSFMVTATDGQVNGGGGVDGFRIKIQNAGGVVYDNKMGSSDDSNDTTAIDGGSIVIHDK